MSVYGKGKRVVRRGTRTIRKAKQTGDRLGALLVIVGVAMAIDGHLVGGTGSLSTAMAFVGDASAVIGLGMMLQQLSR